MYFGSILIDPSDYDETQQYTFANLIKALRSYVTKQAIIEPLKGLTLHSVVLHQTAYLLNAQRLRRVFLRLATGGSRFKLV